ncbi:N-succinylarginine dihydrolase [Stieleria bergensis]|uniref:N-succinylarginine dihydrolase n=1 Tax=Stieleria bergensis TaxID=2528025 RepID=A0A517SRW4_9BACT|nr:N-succinylarginine dihydrolase [Planctomycetes bacterium SV_7m_r]
MTAVQEINFDGLIGPTHHYGGLSFGNLASHRHSKQVSHPKQAALQGLEKMRLLVRLGYQQGFLPPQARPDFNFLRTLGFSGSDDAVIQSAAKDAPHLLSVAYSASSMWAANAATVTVSAESGDGRVHFTPANLIANAHRHLEAKQTQRSLESIFCNSVHFQVHPPLPAQASFSDEGAANHTRLCCHNDQPGVSLFVHGETTAGSRFPARQTLSASQAIARRHGDRHPIMLRQNPRAIDGGAFHNDVVAVGNGPVLLFHESAYHADDRSAAFATLKQWLPNFQPIMVSEQQVSLEDAVQSYLFNSQLLAAPNGAMDHMSLVAPTDCQDSPAVTQFLDQLTTDPANPIQNVHFVDVRQSMSNGGGPACLRLRVPLTPAEQQAINRSFLLDETSIDELCHWVRRHYRDQLAIEDLAAPGLAGEVRDALEDLTDTIGCGPLYPFQT